MATAEPTTTVIAAPAAAATSRQRSFTPEQLEVFALIADTILPGLSGDELEAFKAVVSRDYPDEVNVDDENSPIMLYAREPASATADFQQAVDIMLGHLSQAQFKSISGLMSFLRSRAGALILCRSWKPFHLLSLSERTQVMQMWKDSNFGLYCKVYKGAASLARYCYGQTARVYDGTRIPPRDTEAHGERWEPERLHKYTFEDFSQAGSDVFDADVVIVGSGAGGGVAAKNIAEWAAQHTGKDGRGKVDVLVLEQGEYVPHEELTLTEAECMNRMWERGATTLNLENNLAVGYGRTFGGGTALNWSVSLGTPGAVRREWAEQAGVEFFTSKDYQASIKRVEHRMGASTKNYTHTTTNKLLLSSCRELGYQIKKTPVNSGGYRHSCSHCGHGCRYGEKQGTMNSWLVDASKAGCRFAHKAHVSKVLFEEKDVEEGSASLGGWGWKQKRKVVVGLECLVGDENAPEGRRKIRIRCKKVIVSGGSLNSPALLLRSGLTNPNIGKNLRLHPATIIYGFFPHTHPSVPINSHHGPVISTVITETSSLDEYPYAHYGSRIEAMYMYPIVGFAHLPWFSGGQFKQHLARIKSCVGLFSLARDGRRQHPNSDSAKPTEPTPGFVKLDPHSGDPIFSYVCTQKDRDSIVEGLVVAAEVLRQAGATEILCGIRTLSAYTYSLPDDDISKDEGLLAPGFREWVAQLRKLGADENQLFMSSAHQMGSNRMAGVAWENATEQGETGGVVDPDGRVYGAEGLYVCDASVLPGATGVNPMVTIMSVADLISRKMVDSWEREWFGKKSDAAE